MYEIYNIHSVPDHIAPERWRTLHIFTGNNMDECYIDLPEMGEDETEDEIRWALRRKYGRGYRYAGYEDVTDLYMSADWWAGEGWYRVRWSDGGMDWTSDGPVWFDAAPDLAGELAEAAHEETETHLAYAEYLGCGEEPKEDQDD